MTLKWLENGSEMSRKSPHAIVITRASAIETILFIFIVLQSICMLHIYSITVKRLMDVIGRRDNLTIVSIEAGCV